MSLINEALKKAQSQQQNRASGSGNPGNPAAMRQETPERFPHHQRSSVLPWLIAGGCALALLVLGIGFIFWTLASPRPLAEAPAVALAEPPQSTPAQTPPAPEPSPAAPASPPPPASADPGSVAQMTPPPSEERDVRAVTPSSNPPSTSTITARPADAPQEAPVPQPVESPAPASEAPPAAATLQPSHQTEAVPEIPETSAVAPTHEEVWAVIDRLEIRGIMAGMNRVLVFDPQANRSFAYDKGSTVSRTPLLTIREISPEAITFEDDAGQTHIKSF